MNRSGLKDGLAESGGGLSRYEGEQPTGQQTGSVQ